jgi:hypothetical protein
MVNKWTHAALSAPHTQRHLDAIPTPGARALTAAAAARRGPLCPACGEPLTVIRGLPTRRADAGSTDLPCDCLTERKAND